MWHDSGRSAALYHAHPPPHFRLQEDVQLLHGSLAARLPCAALPQPHRTERGRRKYRPLRPPHEFYPMDWHRHRPGALAGRVSRVRVTLVFLSALFELVTSLASVSMILAKENAPGPTTLGATNGLVQFAMCFSRAGAPALVRSELPFFSRLVFVCL